MKYIMTKDRKIFDLSEISIPYQIVDGWIDFNSQGRFEIVRESDNIEKLFDEYVLEDKDHTYQSLLVKSDRYDKLPFPYSFTKDVKNGWLSHCCEYLKNGYKIYGAIIIRGTHGEPILKPVAAMNDKEGWELL